MKCVFLLIYLFVFSNCLYAESLKLTPSTLTVYDQEMSYVFRINQIHYLVESLPKTIGNEYTCLLDDQKHICKKALNEIVSIYSLYVDEKLGPFEGEDDVLLKAVPALPQPNFDGIKKEYTSPTETYKIMVRDALRNKTNINYYNNILKDLPEYEGPDFSLAYQQLVVNHYDDWYGGRDWNLVKKELVYNGDDVLRFLLKMINLSPSGDCSGILFYGGSAPTCAKFYKGSLNGDDAIVYGNVKGFYGCYSSLRAPVVVAIKKNDVWYIPAYIKAFSARGIGGGIDSVGCRVVLKRHSMQDIVNSLKSMLEKDPFYIKAKDIELGSNYLIYGKSDNVYIKSLGVFGDIFCNINIIPDKLTKKNNSYYIQGSISFDISSQGAGPKMRLADFGVGYLHKIRNHGKSLIEESIKSCLNVKTKCEFYID